MPSFFNQFSNNPTRVRTQLFIKMGKKIGLPDKVVERLSTKLIEDETSFLYVDRDDLNLDYEAARALNKLLMDSWKEAADTGKNDAAKAFRYYVGATVDILERYIAKQGFGDASRNQPAAPKVEEARKPEEKEPEKAAADGAGEAMTQETKA